MDGKPELVDIVTSLLAARQKLREEVSGLDWKVLAIAKDEGTCRRLTTVPGVGPVVALALTSTIDMPNRFRHSKAVGAFLNLRLSSRNLDKASASDASLSAETE